MLCALVLGAPECLAGARIPVAGQLAGQRVATTVDSEIAAYYLEHYLAGRRTNPTHDAWLDAELGAARVDPSDHEALKRLSQRSSADLATLYFVARLYEAPANRRAQEAFHAHLESLKRAPAGNLPRVPEAYRSYVMAFVPGYAYRRDRGTGADFARQREVMSRQGWRSELIETDDLGSVEDNAGVVAEALLRMSREHEQIILVSASKGGPEAALALGERLPADARRHVRAWISVGGLLRGSPYADRALVWPRSWLAKVSFVFRGLRPAAIENLSTRARRPAFARLELPADVLMLQYVGAPLSGHITKDARDRYEALRSLGPNDGLTLLADELVPGGIVVTDVGLDHYYRDPAIELKTLALALATFDELDRRAAGTPNAGR